MTTKIVNQATIVKIVSKNIKYATLNISSPNDKMLKHYISNEKKNIFQFFYYLFEDKLCFNVYKSPTFYPKKTIQIEAIKLTPCF